MVKAVWNGAVIADSDDTVVAGFFTLNRFVRIADGPDEVHMSQLGKAKIKEYVSMNER